MCTLFELWCVLCLYSVCTVFVLCLYLDEEVGEVHPRRTADTEAREVALDVRARPQKNELAWEGGQQADDGVVFVFVWGGVWNHEARSHD